MTSCAFYVASVPPEYSVSIVKGHKHTEHPEVQAKALTLIEGPSVSDWVGQECGICVSRAGRLTLSQELHMLDGKDSSPSGSRKI